MRSGSTLDSNADPAALDKSQSLTLRFSYCSRVVALGRVGMRAVLVYLGLLEQNVTG